MEVRVPKKQGECPHCGNSTGAKLGQAYLYGTPVRSCPKCNGKLQKNKRNYFCECKFKLPAVIAGKELDDAIIGELLDKKVTTEKVQGFTSKAGNLFDAYLKLNEEDRVVFDFEERKIASVGKKLKKLKPSYMMVEI